MFIMGRREKYKGKLKGKEYKEIGDGTSKQRQPRRKGINNEPSSGNLTAMCSEGVQVQLWSSTLNIMILFMVFPRLFR